MSEYNPGHNRTDYVLEDVRDERHAQDEKWGEQNHALPIWHLVLAEEVGEVAEAILEGRASGNYSRERHIQDIREELVQVAAVAVAVIEYIDRGKPEV